MKLGPALTLLAVGSLLPACQSPTQHTPVPKPTNIILILVDDLGWQDTGVAFTPEPTPFQARYRTPNLERLAAVGLRYSNAYATGSVCTPTRAGLLSGEQPARTHITDWTLHTDRDFSRKMPNLADPDWCKTGLSPGPLLLPELLRNQGYRTIFIGKAHFAAIGTPGADPLNLGFDVNIAGHAAGAPGSYYGTDNFGNQADNPWAVPGLEKYHGQDIFLTEALTLEMERELEVAASDGRPFFLDFSHYAVHTPIQADERFAPAYREAGLDNKEAAYASLIEGVDHSIGRMLLKLEELDLAENTLIVFTSDNGGYSVGARGLTPSGTGSGTHNAPLRSGKSSGYEGGIRVPFIVGYADDAIHGVASDRFHSPGRLLDTPITTNDLYYTFVAFGHKHAVPPAIPYREGVNLSKHWRLGLDIPPRVLAWNYPHKWGPKGDRYEPFTALRDGDWKIIYWYESAEWELFHLGDDLGERNNLMAAQAEKAAQMQDALREWMVQNQAQRPMDKASGEMLPIP